MNDVCQLLKETRLDKGLTLEEVAQRTYIKLHYLEALEEGRLEKLPAMVHTYGYIRQYAKLLGLDGGSLVAQFQQQERASTAPAKPGARTPSADLFGESLGFLKPMKPAYGNGNGNGHGHHANGNGHHLPTALAMPEAPLAPLPSGISPEMPIQPMAPAAELPEPVAYAAPEPVTAPMPAVPAPSLLVPSPSLPEPFMPSPFSQPAAASVPAAPASYFTPPRGSDPQDVLEAQARAQQILLDAEREARHLVRGAEAYADEVLGQLEAEVGQTLQIVQNGRAFLASRRLAPQARLT
jgi:transcriptional regulator with XRE-family HTH domain